jgi:hypothetical protein
VVHMLMKNCVKSFVLRDDVGLLDHIAYDDLVSG